MKPEQKRKRKKVEPKHGGAKDAAKDADEVKQTKKTGSDKK